MSSVSWLRRQGPDGWGGFVCESPEVTWVFRCGLPDERTSCIWQYQLLPQRDGVGFGGLWAMNKLTIPCFFLVVGDLWLISNPVTVVTAFLLFPDVYRRRLGRLVDEQA
jgi:hypothetical protein